MPDRPANHRAANHGAANHGAPIRAADVSPAEMDFLVARAGLSLNPGQMADLVLIWRQMAALIAALPRERPLADDAALAFRSSLPHAARNGGTGRE